MDLFNVLILIGGLCLFLFGMDMAKGNLNLHEFSKYFRNDSEEFKKLYEEYKVKYALI